jgi:hypothetical protein
MVTWLKVEVKGLYQGTDTGFYWDGFIFCVSVTLHAHRLSLSPHTIVFSSLVAIAMAVLVSPVIHVQCGNRDIRVVPVSIPAQSDWSNLFCRDRSSYGNMLVCCLCAIQILKFSSQHILTRWWPCKWIVSPVRNCHTANLAVRLNARRSIRERKQVASNVMELPTIPTII